MENENKGTNIYEKLLNVQNKVVVPKSQFNEQGKYRFRSAEDILCAVKPFLAEEKALILLHDEIENLGKSSRSDKGTILETPYNYIKAVATFIDIESGEKIETQACAKECNHNGMTPDQCTGTASSYARKYALNALLAINDVPDPDSNEVSSLDRQNNAPKPEQKSWGKAPETREHNNPVVAEKQEVKAEVREEVKEEPREEVKAVAENVKKEDAVTKKTEISSEETVKEETAETKAEEIKTEEPSVEEKADEPSVKKDADDEFDRLMNAPLEQAEEIKEEPEKEVKAEVKEEPKKAEEIKPAEPPVRKRGWIKSKITSSEDKKPETVNPAPAKAENTPAPAKAENTSVGNKPSWNSEWGNKNVSRFGNDTTPVKGWGTK